MVESPTPAQQADDSKNTPKKDAFDQRHAKELGVGSFAKDQLTNTFLPIATAGAGWAAGYFALSGPAAKLLPRLNDAAGASEVAVGKLTGLAGALIRKQSPQEFLENSGIKLTPKEFEQVAGIWNKEGTSFDRRVVEIAKAIGLEVPKVSKSFQHGSGIALGAVGLLGGGIAVGYKEWKKKESTRLAAQEVNKDIANMGEVLKPSDAQLLAENKRLRAMVDALPSPTVESSSLQHEGVVAGKQQVGMT